MEMLLVVDEHDNVIGEEEKERCHDGEGILHRAFLAMVFDMHGNIVLARRSDSKRLWPGYWDGTVASHVTRGENYLSSTRRRLREEIGLETDLITYLFKFRYQVAYKNAGAEHEICGVTMVERVNPADLSPDPAEISELKLLSLEQLAAEVRDNSGSYTPWLILALDEITKREIPLFATPASRS